MPLEIFIPIPVISLKGGKRLENFWVYLYCMHNSYGPIFVSIGEECEENPTQSLRKQRVRDSMKAEMPRFWSSLVSVRYLCRLR